MWSFTSSEIVLFPLFFRDKETYAIAVPVRVSLTFIIILANRKSQRSHQFFLIADWGLTYFILCESMQNYAYSVKILYCTCRKRVRNPALYRCVHFIKLAWYRQWYQSISKPCLWPWFQVPILELQGWIKNEANYICSFYCMTGYCIYRRSLGDFNQCSSPKYFCTKIVERI